MPARLLLLATALAAVLADPAAAQTSPPPPPPGPPPLDAPVPEALPEAVPPPAGLPADADPAAEAPAPTADPVRVLTRTTRMVRRRFELGVSCRRGGTVTIRTRGGRRIAARRYRCTNGDATVAFRVTRRIAHRLRRPQARLRVVLRTGGRAYRSTLLLDTGRRAAAARADGDWVQGARVNCLNATSNTSGQPWLLAGTPVIFQRPDLVGLVDQWTIHRNHLWQYSNGWQYLGSSAWVWGEAPLAGWAGHVAGTGFWVKRDGQWVWYAHADWDTQVDPAYYSIVHDVYWAVGARWTDRTSLYANHFNAAYMPPGAYHWTCYVG